MKRLIYILIAGVLLLSSCKIEDGDNFGDDYVVHGYVAFEGVFMAFNKDMGNVSFVLAVNDYIQGDETKRAEMENGVFKDVRISQTAGQWIFDHTYGEDKEIIRYVIGTNGGNLLETGSSWNITKINNADRDKTDSEGKFNIKCTGPDSWEMNIEWFRYFNWNKEGNNDGYINTAEAVFYIKRTAFTESGGYQRATYNVNGPAVYTSGEERDFKIESAMSGANITVFSADGFYPFARKKTETATFKITVKNRSSRTDHITAVVNGYNVSISFNKKKNTYQVPDFTGLPKPPQPKHILQP